jgi:hypothetical protein
MSSLLLNTFPMEDRSLDKCTKRGEAVVRVPMDLGVAFFEKQSLLRRDILEEILKLRRG